MKLKILNLNRNKFIIFILIMFSGCFLAGKILGIDNNGDVEITKVMYDPLGGDNKEGELSSYEKVEIKNISGDNVDISNWEIRIGKYYKPFKLLKSIPANSRVIIYLGIGLDDNINFENSEVAYLYLNEKGSKLGDSYGEVALYNNDSNNENTIVDYVIYKIPLEYKDLSTSYAHAVSGKIWIKECFLDDLVEGDALIVENNKCKDFTSKEDEDNNQEKYVNYIKINEILPSPKGKDDEGEYIELYNFGKKDIDLNESKGWIIEDRVGVEKTNPMDNKYKKLYFNKYLGEKIIKAGVFLLIRGEKDFNFSLTGEDELKLINPDGVEVDKISYSDARENFSYGYCEKTNKWRWSEFLTPGSKNEFREAGGIEIEIDEDVYRNVYANFEVRVGGIKDKNLKVKWEFGDGKNSYKNKTRHKYAKKGKYIIKLRVFDGSEDVKKEFNIEVVDFPEKKVNIVAINPNPEGKDSENEWIELKNKSKKKIDLKDWSVATGVNKKKLTNHPIYEEFIIKAGKIRQLTKDFSKFSLNNEKGYIELRSPDGEVVYDLKYKKEEGIGENEIFKKKDGGGWEWLKGLVVSLNNNDEKENEKELVKSMEVEKETGVEIDKGELVRDMTPEDIGKYSGKEVENMIYNYTKEDLKNIQIKENSSLVLEKQVLGVINNKDKKIREAGGFYYFNPESKMEKHYLLKFFEKYFSNLV
ncbi:MAG: hypothetical protein ACD_7C00086G0019 [uncultured bacterium]|nr:MAG: hypothetical protein ACD_7C00086G0019 [uncultured bacterium]HBR79771.1 hypothetical protein [Candidatus Moranbacteria bacterium]